jgi:hypothetical protein
MFTVAAQAKVPSEALLPGLLWGAVAERLACVLDNRTVFRQLSVV